MKPNKVTKSGVMVKSLRGSKLIADKKTFQVLEYGCTEVFGSVILV